ncbi:hypothetical protein ACFL3A_15095, partial [Pseudomonadota bacterium]
MLRTRAFGLLAGVVVSLCAGCVMSPVQQEDTRPVAFIELTIEDAHQAIRGPPILIDNFCARSAIS